LGTFVQWGSKHVIPVAGLGDLRQASVGVDDRRPGSLVDLLNRRMDRRGQPDRLRRSGLMIITPSRGG